MQELFLLLLLIIALYYLYVKLIKNRGCDCGRKSCGVPALPKDKKKSD